jgi:hypothetical protein
MPGNKGIVVEFFFFFLFGILQVQVSFLISVVARGTRSRREDNIKLSLQEVGWGDLDWTDVAQ